MLRNHYQVDVATRLRNGVDQSTALATIRRVTGRPLEVVDPRPFPPALTADEIAYRIRLPGATTRPVAGE